MTNDTDFAAALISRLILTSALIHSQPASWLEETRAMELFGGEDLYEHDDPEGYILSLLRQAATSNLELSPAVRKTQALGAEVDLREGEVLVLALAEILSNDVFRDCLAYLITRFFPDSPAHEVLGVMLGVDPPHLESVLKPDSLLRRARLIGGCDGRTCQRGDDEPALLKLIEPGPALEALNASPATEETSACASLLVSAKEMHGVKVALPENDSLIDNLIHTLGQAGESPVRQTQILIWGMDYLTRRKVVNQLVAQIGWSAAYVNGRENQDTGLDLRARDELIVALQFSEAVLERRQERTVLVAECFDDMFPRNSGRFCGDPSHQSYEPNPVEYFVSDHNPPLRVPVIWLAGSLEDVDPAFLSLFDLVAQVKPPNVETRETVVAPLISAGLDSELIQDFLCPDFPIANLERMVSTIVNQNQSMALDRLEQHAKFVLKSTAVSLGVDLPTKNEPEHPSKIIYSTRFINADQDIEGLLEKACFSSNLRILLWGETGTGKTAWAEEFAERSGRRLMKVDARDLLNCYYGESEKNIGRTFSTAQSEDAVLQIDEVDSFLSCRDTARTDRGLEARLVNQFLVSIDRYDGTLIATTNRLAAIDPAALRRFELKVQLRCLTTDQAASLAAILLDDADDLTRQRLKRRLSSPELVNRLTPADFRTVERKAAWLSKAIDTDFLIENLVSEAKFRDSECCNGDERRGIGFCASI